MLNHKLMKFIQCQLEKIRPTSACWQDGFVEGGLDNTHTVYTHTNQVFLTTFDDGTTDTFGVSSASGWTDQVSQMSAGLGSIMPWAQTVEPFCNLPGGCGGLPEPLLKLNQMAWRYVGFRICHGGKVPVSVSYTSDQQVEPKELILQYKKSDIIYLDRCFTCGEGEKFFLRGTSTEYTPVCPAPCGTIYPDTPLVTCTNYPPISACDNLGTSGQGDDVPIVVLYKDCGNGLEVDYMFDDGTGLVPYTLVGDPVDCLSGEIIAPPVQPCEDFLIDKLFTSTGLTGLLNSREWFDTQPYTPIGQGTNATGQAYIDAHDFSLPISNSGTQNSFVLNDTDNTASKMDIQILDGFIKLAAPMYVRYTSSAEGYTQMQLGKCGGELTKVLEGSGIGYQTSSYLLPAGIHDIRIWNVDQGGTNSSSTFQYSADGVNWTSDNTPPGIEFSNQPIVETCTMVKICKPSGDLFDYLTGTALNKADFYPCSLDCTPSGDCGCSGINVVTP